MMKKICKSDDLPRHFQSKCQVWIRKKVKSRLVKKSTIKRIISKYPILIYLRKLTCIINRILK